MRFQCLDCQHFLWRRLGQDCCGAFPDGIPDEIWLGSIDHCLPHAGDHGIVGQPFDASADRGHAIETRHDAWARGRIIELAHADHPPGEIALGVMRGARPAGTALATV